MHAPMYFTAARRTQIKNCQEPIVVDRVEDVSRGTWRRNQRRSAPVHHTPRNSINKRRDVRLAHAVLIAFHRFQRGSKFPRACATLTLPMMLAPRNLPVQRVARSSA